MLIQIRRCCRNSCLRPFRLHKFKPSATCVRRRGIIACPYCQECIDADKKYVYESHPLSAEEEVRYEQTGSLPQQEE